MFKLKHDTILKIERLIAQHMERVWMKLDVKRVRQSIMLMKMIQEAMEKKLKEKYEEIRCLGSSIGFFKNK